MSSNHFQSLGCFLGLGTAKTIRRKVGKPQKVNSGGVRYENEAQRSGGTVRRIKPRTSAGGHRGSLDLDTVEQFPRSPGVGKSAGQAASRPFAGRDLGSAKGEEGPMSRWAM